MQKHEDPFKVRARRAKDLIKSEGKNKYYNNYETKFSLAIVNKAFSIYVQIGNDDS